MYNTIYPSYINNYRGLNNQIVKRKEDEDQSQSSAQAREQQREITYGQNQYPNGQQVAIDYSKPSVNISQIITDFKNTTHAIGAPEDISSQVNSYLSLIQAQAEKTSPNRQIIKSNLKNASQVLDEYISESLNKPSKVVENWIDALFLQKVDYKANETDINPEFQVDLPQKAIETGAAANLGNNSFGEESTEQNQSIEAQNEITSQKIYIPEDKQLRRMFIQAKKYSSIEQNDKALDSFKQTLDYAKQIDDKQAQSLVYYEVGRIYDKSDCLPEALKSYNKALENTTDNNIKARSHISMAQIYDDVVQVDPAINHYHAAISFAGETDNLNVQTKALSNLAGLYSDKYDKDTAFQYISLANNIAKETNNDKTIANTYKKSAQQSEQLDEKPKALDFYKESTKYYNKIESDENVVQNYQSAANLMLNLGDKDKAKKLLTKAYIRGQNIDNTQLLNQITKQLTSL